MQELFSVCLRLGRLMLTSGAETYRVEETVERVARACGAKEVASFVTPTGIFLTVEGQTQIARVTYRTIDLEKVAAANQLSRLLEEGRIHLQELETRLEALEKKGFTYPAPWVHGAGGGASAFFTFLFGGTWEDFLPVFAAGVLVNLSYFTLTQRYQVKFVAEFLSALVGGVCILFLYRLGWGVHLNSMMIGMLMPLVPGVAITNAVRDLMAGDLVAGVARGAEATLTAFALAAGAAIVLAIST